MCGSNVRSTAVALALLLLAAAALLGCSAERSDRVIEAKDVTGLGVIKIRALDQPGNPYVGQYGEWDQWVYDNVLIEPLAYEDGVKPESLKILKARVTADGYLLPQLEKVRAYHEQMRLAYDDESHGVKNIAPYSVQAAGIMTEQLADALYTAIGRIKAEYYMPVPKWLADEPPLHALLVPNGDVITFGARGSGLEGSDSSTGCCGGGSESYYRYSHGGKLLRTSPSFWFDLYVDDGASARPPGERRNRHDGYFYYTDPETDEILSVWDWNGTELELPILPPVRDIHPFVSLAPKQIRNIYEGQN